MSEGHQNQALTQNVKKRILTTDYDPSLLHMTLTPIGIVRGYGITELSIRTEIGSILNSINGGTRLVNQVKANEHHVTERSVIDMVNNAQNEYSINFYNEDYCILGVQHEIIHVTSHMLGCMVTGTLFKKNKVQVPQVIFPQHGAIEPYDAGSMHNSGGRKRIKRPLRRSLRSNRRRRTKQTRSRSK